MSNEISQKGNNNRPQKRPRIGEPEGAGANGLFQFGEEEQRQGWVPLHQARRWKLESDKLKQSVAGFCFQLRRATQEIKDLKDQIGVLESREDGDALSMKGNYEKDFAHGRQQREVDLAEKHAETEEERERRYAETVRLMRDELMQKRAQTEAARQQALELESEVRRLREELKKQRDSLGTERESTNKAYRFQTKAGHEIMLDDAKALDFQAQLRKLEKRIEQLERENTSLRAFREGVDHEPTNQRSAHYSVQSPNRKRNVCATENFDKMFHHASTFANEFEHVNLKQLVSWVSNWKCRFSSGKATCVERKACLDKIGFFSPGHNREEVAPDRSIVDGVRGSHPKDDHWNKMFQCYQKVGRRLGTYDLAKLERWIHGWISRCEDEDLSCEEKTMFERLKVAVDRGSFRRMEKQPASRRTSFETNLNNLREFRTKFGKLRIPKAYDASLHNWEKRMIAALHAQESDKKQDISPERLGKLKEIKLMECEHPYPRGRDAIWKHMACLLDSYEEQHGDCCVLASFDKRLNAWVLDQEDLVKKTATRMSEIESWRYNYLHANNLFQKLRKAIADLRKQSN